MGAETAWLETNNDGEHWLWVQISNSVVYEADLDGDDKLIGAGCACSYRLGARTGVTVRNDGPGLFSTGG